MSGQKRLERYQRVARQLEELLSKTDDRTAHCATAAALLHHNVPGVSWTGFYFLKNGELVVDAYQGPLACQVLERHAGVCWAAIDTDSTQLEADVHAFPGHNACDDRSRSEVVGPIHDREGRPSGGVTGRPASCGPSRLRPSSPIAGSCSRPWSGSCSRSCW